METKYSIGDMMWFMHRNQATSCVISRITISQEEASGRYNPNGISTVEYFGQFNDSRYYSTREDQLCTSKEELLAQL